MTKPNKYAVSISYGYGTLDDSGEYLETKSINLLWVWDTKGCIVDTTHVLEYQSPMGMGHGNNMTNIFKSTKCINLLWVWDTKIKEVF